MNGYDSNRNATQQQTNYNINSDNQSLLKCQQLLEIVNQTDTEGENDFQLFLSFRLISICFCDFQYK